MPVRKNKPYGFTLLELLVIVAMLAILGGIVFATFAKLRGQVGLEQSATKISQDVQKCRSLAIAKDRACRLRFRNGNSYVVELAAGSKWRRQHIVKLPRDVHGNWQSGDAITFTPLGYASFPTSPSPYVITITKGKDTYDIVPTMVGAVRVVKR